MESQPHSPGHSVWALTIIVATTNANKVREIISVLEAMKHDDRNAMPAIDFRPLDSASGVPEAIEDGQTFAEIAALKAVHYAQLTGRLCLADDSGLEVDALGGKPGIHSARFAGHEHHDFESCTRPQRDALNNEKLLRLLSTGGHARPWTARFVCSMCLASPEGRAIATSRGTLDGTITDCPAGRNGFGYDPLVYLPDLGCTVAELTEAQKNARSHRGNATRALLAQIAAGDLNLM